MSKRGKIMGAIVFILLFGSIGLFLFGRSGKAITIGIIGLGVTLVYVMLLSVIASFNKARMRRRAYEDIHEMAKKDTDRR